VIETLAPTDKENNMQTATTPTVNGIDPVALMQTADAIRQEPKLGRFQFRAANRWLGGTRTRSMIRSFYGAGKEDDTRTKTYVLDTDEPAVFLGRDEGANPVEHLLNALAGCVTTAMVMHAASRGIHIESVDSQLEGDIDVRAFLGLTRQVPLGYRQIRVKLKVKTDADAEKLKQLAMMSPVYNTIVNPTPVEITVETE
jgi:uncharacterized OsmC-like protein